MDALARFVLAPILLEVGAIAGTLAGLLSVGGGIVFASALYWMTEVGLLNVAPEVAVDCAVASSLLPMIPTSISSARAHHIKMGRLTLRWPESGYPSSLQVLRSDASWRQVSMQQSYRQSLM